MSEDPQNNEDPKQNKDFKQNADPVVKPPSLKPTQLASDSNATPKTQKATGSSSPEAIPPKVGESNQQVKQPQPEANAKYDSDQPAKTDPKPGVMNANPPHGQTGSKGVAPGAVPVTEEAPTKQVAQLY